MAQAQPSPRRTAQPSRSATHFHPGGWGKASWGTLSKMPAQVVDSSLNSPGWGAPKRGLSPLRAGRSPNGTSPAQSPKDGTALQICHPFSSRRVRPGLMGDSFEKCPRKLLIPGERFRLDRSETRSVPIVRRAWPQWHTSRPVPQ